MHREKKPEPLPPFPDELLPVWERFLRLSRRRQAGMASNPLTYSEIEAFARLNRISLSAWEADLYCRLDDAVLAAWRGDQPETKPPDPEEGIPVSDVKSLRQMMRATAQRTRLIAEAKAQVAAERQKPKPGGGAHG